MRAATPQSFRRDVAVELLTQSDFPLLEVAYRVGFSETSTFHCALKGWTGLRPGAYRQARNEPVPGVTDTISLSFLANHLDLIGDW